MTVRPSVDSVTANVCIQASVKEGDVLQHVLCMSQGGSDSTGAERQEGDVLQHVLCMFQNGSRGIPTAVVETLGRLNVSS